jgi:TP901 family phage tail tape measure protein
MAKGFNIRAWLGLETKNFRKGLTKAQRGLNKFHRGLRSTNDILRGLKFTAIGVTGVGALSRAITTLKDFETNMARVKVISQATEEEFVELTKTAREIGATTRFSATEAAQGLQFLSMAGLSASESIETLKPVLDLAAAGAIEVGRSADILTNVLAGFNLEVTEATRVANVFAQTARSSNQDIEELYEGVKLLAPGYNILGRSIEEAARDMALLANSGIKAEQAGTALAGSLTFLLKQPPLVKKALKELGVEVTEESLREKGLVEVMMELVDAGINGRQMVQILGRHWKTAGAIISKSTEEIAEMTAKINDNTDAAKDMSEQGIGGIDKALKLLKSALDELFISLGHDAGLSGFLQSVIMGTRDLISWFTKLSSTGKVLNAVLIAMIFNLGKVNTAIRIARIAIIKFTAATGVATKGVKAFNLALKTNVYGLIATGIIGIAVALNGFIEANRQARKEKFDYFKSLREAADPKNLAELSDEELVAKGRKLQQEIKRIQASLDRGGQSLELDANLRSQIERYKEIVAAIYKEAAARDEANKNAKEKVNLLKQAAQFEKDQEALQKAAEEDQKRLKALKGQNKAMEILVGESKTYASTLREISTTFDSSGFARIVPVFSQSLGFIRAINKEGLDTKTLAKIKPIPNETLSSLEKFNNLMFSSRFSMDNLKKGVEQANMSMLEFAQEGSKNFKQLGRDLGNVVRDVIKQQIAMGIASAVSSALRDAPWPLNLIAAPIAAAAATTLFNTVIPAFATGGIVPGNSFSGDRVPIMANSGELVLNQGQQANLFKMIDRGAMSGLRQVEFILRGDKLIGLIKNEQQKRQRFGG